MANGRIVPQSNAYTVMLAVALAIVVASAVYVSIKLSGDYNTLFNIVKP
jgi:hypothetical protein